MADEAVWSGLVSEDRRMPAVPSGPFAHDFSEVLLPGDTHPIALTPVQTALLRVLRMGVDVPLTARPCSSART